MSIPVFRQATSDQHFNYLRSGIDISDHVPVTALSHIHFRF